MKLHYELASSSSSFALPAPHPTLQACIKNLEILSFPSFRLPLCLPKRTRHSCNIRQDEKKLSAAWSISKFQKQKKASKGRWEREFLWVVCEVCERGEGWSWVGWWVYVISSFPSQQQIQLLFPFLSILEDSLNDRTDWSGATEVTAPTGWLT